MGAGRSCFSRSGHFRDAGIRNCRAFFPHGGFGNPRIILSEVLGGEGDHSVGRAIGDEEDNSSSAGSSSCLPPSVAPPTSSRDGPGVPPRSELHPAISHDVFGVIVGGPTGWRCERRTRRCGRCTCSTIPICAARFSGWRSCGGSRSSPSSPRSSAKYSRHNSETE